MRAAGEVLLLSAYELGHPPHGTALPAAFLGRAGFAPVQLDLSRQPLDDAAARAARLVAISVPMHTALRLGASAADRIRAANPRAFIVMHGLYAWLNGEHLLARHADAVIGGEAEAVLVALAEDLARGGTGAVAGIWTRGAARPAPVLAKLQFPVPDRRGLPEPDAYAQLELGAARRPVAYTEASRGCLHACLHCPIPPVYGGRFFVIPEAVVLEDVRRQVAAGARHVTFGDPDFLNGPGHSLRIVRALHAEFPDVTFDFTAKVEHLLHHRARLPELVALGAAFAVTAVESLSDTVLARLEKGHTRADVFAAIAAAREAGLVLRPSFVPFTPWATLDDYVELVEWVATDLSDRVEPVQLSIRLLVPPGSSLLARPWMREHVTGLDPGAFTWAWRHPDPRMDALQRRVAALADDGAVRRAAPDDTLAQIREEAYRARGTHVPGFAPPPPIPPRLRSPRLTEPWFC